MRRAVLCTILSLGPALWCGTEARCDDTSSASGSRRPVAQTGKAKPGGGTPPVDAVSKAEAAARLEEGRRKFFQQEQGFDHDTGPPNFAIGNVLPFDQYGFPTTVPLPKRR